MEDNLESVLHCDDKEKLRRKLALLQREYSRTVQRLQRAERSDAVRKHVRSRISEQNLQDQTDPGTASTSPNPALPSLSLVSPARTAPGSASPLGLAGDSTVAASCLVESENPRWRSPSVRFLLSVDDSCPRTPDLNPDPAGGHRRSPSLRLRSRRSRQRWERRGRAQGGEGGRAGSRDLQAVILNQLNRGRHRRSRGRTSNTHTLSDSLAQPSNSQTNHTSVEGPSANQMLTSESGTNQSECLPSRACSVRPIRGRRRRGRGRRPRLGRSLSLDSRNLQHQAQTTPRPRPLLP
ncbi:hypothetical protein J4Q44_G00291270 [Coregonus suidteri]|uniref:Partner and localizer of BRCA2 n=1 Tax=Coregonus suidteri TaxID=861788 RepID=A0AAN8KTY2_9TELE